MRGLIRNLNFLAVMFLIFMGDTSKASERFPDQAIASNIGETGFQDNESNASKSYVTGMMNGVHLSILKNYLVSDVTYENEIPLRKKQKSSGNSQYKNISDFGILVRLSNFSPRVSPQDWKDWSAASTKAHPSFMKSWMMADFDNRHRVDLAQLDMPEKLHEDDAHWGPFVRDKNLENGLIHYESVQSVDDNPVGHVEYFYQKSSRTTILCKTHRVHVAPFDTYDECQHYFFVPDLNVMAEAFYTKADLPRWNEIESQIKKTVHSFINK
ncbi:hypothetical protein P3T18_004443 [Paraburkholderia sp. GAS199]|uniref:hypothetical protein n=1 Tax=Paraburkholderia sp. GAS199 TaxID=3035126 RepID=UPI003D24088A